MCILSLILGLSRALPFRTRVENVAFFPLLLPTFSVMPVDNLVASLSTLDLKNEESVTALGRDLDEFAKLLANSPQERYERRLSLTSLGPYCLFRVDAGRKKELWDGLYRLWQTLTRRCLEASQPDQSDITLLCSMARFTRNLVAGIPENQVAALSVLLPCCIVVS